MVCFQAAAGNVNAQRNLRGKHYVLFDLPADKGVQLKAAQPDLGWASDMEGYPALPFSVASRLILQTMAERDNRNVSLFDEFPTAQLFARLWSNIVGHMTLESDCIFTEVQKARVKVENQDIFYSVAGDWQAVEGDPDGEDLTRWVPCISRGDVFAEHPGAGCGLAGAEILYYVGPYMLNAHRDDESHFVVAAGTMGKLFQSDEDVTLCDGAQLAAEIAEGILDSTWPDILMQVSPGSPDSSPLYSNAGASMQK